MIQRQNDCSERHEVNPMGSGQLTSLFVSRWKIIMRQGIYGRKKVIRRVPTQ